MAPAGPLLSAGFGGSGGVEMAAVRPPEKSYQQYRPAVVAMTALETSRGLLTGRE
jgi:hypothetical protein